ncbi:condensin complex subunit 3 [Ceratina calcarata]|uniref:Condensin complex subunit 3 n=1 Tax=Ceratina calcarata TaxID=156304 RepID=A0AAJ7JF44_9HYME|nr:condensin complex subunit 3 [Ceratina calcarata]
MKRSIQDIVKQIFYNVQFGKTCHQKNMKTLKELYEHNDLTEFWSIFELCFKVPLSIPQQHPRVQNVLMFIAKFAASLYIVAENDESEESMCPFLAKLFDFILTNHHARETGVRFRICHFLNMLLNAMGDQAFIDDNLCDRITNSMMERLLDRSPKVRVQAIFALHRLQDPMDDQCPVIKMYMFHALKDPNAEVRRAAINNMGKNQKTLQVAIKKTRDVDERVRKVAYIFISKITVRSLTIIQRDQLLNDGLKDRSEIVKTTVRNVLLPAWLKHFNGEYISLIKALDAEIGTDVSVLALETLFKDAQLSTLIEELPIDKETKLIPLKNLVSENALYWKCLARYVQREFTEELEQILPELTTFCTYISDFIALMSSQQTNKWVKDMQKFVLLQLFEITTFYDLSDEVGRKKLQELILNTLMGNHWTEEIIECVVTHLVKVIPDVNTRLDTLANVISDIRLPLKETAVTQISEEQQQQINLQKAKLRIQLLELKDEEYQAIQDKEYLKADNLKNQIDKLNEKIKTLSEPAVVPVISNEEVREKSDSDTMIKCLSIICTMMHSVTSLTPTLRGLMQIFHDSLDHPNDKVHVLAIKGISICSILDKSFAKEHILILFLQFSLEQENNEIWIMTLKGIFDLFLLYGLDYFDILENVSEGDSNKTANTEKSRTKLYTDNDSEVAFEKMTQNFTGDGNCNIINILTELLENEDEKLRTVATEGLCKLLLNRRIAGTKLISRLIILCFNPVNDNDFYLRQCLSGFFSNFIVRIPDAVTLLEQIYLPTLATICNAPETSPLREVDPYDISKFMLNLIHLGSRKPGPHNNLVFTILAEVLNPESNIDQQMLIVTLKNVRINLEDNAAKEDLRKAIADVKDQVDPSEKRLLQCIRIFERKIDAPEDADMPMDEDTEAEDNDN